MAAKRSAEQAELILSKEEVNGEAAEGPTKSAEAAEEQQSENILTTDQRELVASFVAQASDPTFSANDLECSARVIPLRITDLGEKLSPSSKNRFLLLLDSKYLVLPAETWVSTKFNKKQEDVLRSCVAYGLNEGTFSADVTPLVMLGTVQRICMKGCLKRLTASGYLVEQNGAAL